MLESTESATRLKFLMTDKETMIEKSINKINTFPKQSSIIWVLGVEFYQQSDLCNFDLDVLSLHL